MAHPAGRAVRGHPCPGEDEEPREGRGPAKDGGLCWGAGHLLGGAHCYGFSVFCRGVVYKKIIWKR